MAQITAPCMPVLRKISQLTFNGLARSAISPLVIKAKNYSTIKKESKVTKSVFISQSRDIFSNLALEDWIYKNFDLTNHHVLMLWQNDPCVVIGRHQNPWLEANVSDTDVTLARRNSGGGTVYHDQGNLNLTFFTAKDSYNRKNNLELIGRALFREWGVQSEINEREDIVVNGGQKISGTASKLGRPNAYHHCTLLVDVDMPTLRQALRKEDFGISTNATRSVPSPVVNLHDVEQRVKVEKLLAAVGWEYLRTHAHTLQDGGKELISQQNGFTMINPIEYYFPGLDEIRNEFSSWEWCYGRTPKFDITRSFPTGESADMDQELSITLQVMKGVVEDATIKIPSGLMPENGFLFDDNITNLRGSRFSEESMVDLQKSLSNATKQKSLEFFANSMRFRKD